jgi:hypothetical protein
MHHCITELPHDITIWPKNHAGLPEGMEAAGAASLRNCLFETGKVAIGEFVSNDDLSC